MVNECIEHIYQRNGKPNNYSDNAIHPILST